MTVTDGRTVREVLAEAGAMTLPALRQAAEGLPERTRHPVGVHFGWWDSAGAPLEAGSGKMVRPALTLLACEAADGAPAAGLPAAVAVELLHNASLLHDDIIDGDRMRRGRPALWATMGIPAALLAGDALFFLAVQVLEKAPAPLGETGVGRLTAAVQELIEGEYADTALESRPEAPVAECEAVASGKTGTLFAGSCALGALAGGAGTDQVEALRAFGAHLGTAFQLVDDLLGIWGEPMRTGKPARTDLASRKNTLPIAFALTAGGAPGRELAHLYARQGPLSPQELERAAHLVEASGARAWAAEQANRHTQAAAERLKAARPARTAATAKDKSSEAAKSYAPSPKPRSWTRCWKRPCA